MFDRPDPSTARRLDQTLAGRRAAASPATADPYLAGWLGRLHPEAMAPRIESGMVVDVAPGLAAYRVSAGPRSFLWCSPGGTAGAFGVTGGRPLHTFPIGTQVYFVRHPETSGVGTIVAAEPHWSAHTANQPADGIWPFVRSGQAADIAHRYPVIASANLAAQGEVQLGGVDVVDLAAGRPLDTTAAGEWGTMAETGVGVFADPWQAYLRVDETTGVFAFYPDQMLRVAGHNYQHVTSHVEEEHLEDEGELAGWARRCVYPWEAYGLWRWNQLTPGWAADPAANNGWSPGQGVGLNDPVAVQAAGGFAAREPELYRQLPAARVHTWAGYLGQGGKEVVAAPVQLAWAYPDAPAASIRAAVPVYLTQADVLEQEPDDAQIPAPSGRVSVDGSVAGPGNLPYLIPPNARGGPDQPGLFEEHHTLTGGLHVRSARRVLIAKYPVIPVARPVRRPEDPAGDAPSADPAAYAPSGLKNETTVHRVAADIPPVAGPGQRACMLPDVLAYAFNWENLHPFAYHAKDWAVAEEGAAGSLLVNQVAPDYTTLATLQYLAAPAPVFLDVDHRYGFAPVYQTAAYFGLLDDGTVVLSDGAGSEIRMAGGNIEFHAPGDIAFFPSRHLLAWAGRDVALKAHNSVDLTAANADLRLKAQRNLHGLAGNGGCGGFLWESKAKCPASAFADRLGEEVISSGFTVLVPNSQFLVAAADVAVTLDPDAPDGSRIFLDAAGPGGEVYFRGQTIVSDASVQNGAVVHLFDGNDVSGGEAGANEFTAAYTLLGGDLIATGNTLFGGTGPVTGGFTLGDANARITYLTETYRPAFEEQVVFPAAAAAAEFSCRTTPQYLAAAYAYWQARWTSIAAGAGTPPDEVWVEPAVVGLRSEALTRPHPGAGRWADSAGYAAHPFAYTDPTAGWTAIGRAANLGTYEAAACPAPVLTPLVDTYPVLFPVEDPDPVEP